MSTQSFEARILRKCETKFAKPMAIAECLPMLSQVIELEKRGLSMCTANYSCKQLYLFRFSPSVFFFFFLNLLLS